MYLAQWKASHTVLSATVYAHMIRDGVHRSSEPGPLVAFGDPDDSRRETGEAEILAFGTPWAEPGREMFLPLPASRFEIEAVASHFPGRQKVYLGREATEERATAVGEEPRFIHFASHAFYDERRPLDSGLVLSQSPSSVDTGRNGILQAWEILEKMKLDADLVVLSACDTGRGSEVAGEGLLGLARAFQHVGARAVVASLWEVTDLSTVAFMDLFYGGLRAGLGRAEALRAAQVTMLTGPIELPRQDGFRQQVDVSHPRYWAGLQLIGNGR